MPKKHLFPHCSLHSVHSCGWVWEGLFRDSGTCCKWRLAGGTGRNGSHWVSRCLLYFGWIKVPLERQAREISWQNSSAQISKKEMDKHQKGTELQGDFSSYSAWIHALTSSNTTSMSSGIWKTWDDGRDISKWVCGQEKSTQDRDRVEGNGGCSWKTDLWGEGRELVDG